jgi:membrane-bound metal-dependent hydrolase YbcI (DUF457 family)
MTYKTHRLINLTLAVDLCIATSAGALTAAILIPTAYVSADWPDRIEGDDAIARGEHRKGSHYAETGLLAAAATFALAQFTAPAFAVALALGVLLGHWGHLFADSLNLGAIPVPATVRLAYRLAGRSCRKTFRLIPKRLKWLRVRVGKAPEKIFVRGAVALSLAIVVVAWANALRTPNHGKGVLGPILSGEQR